jgi:hypothetical protein
VAILKRRESLKGLFSFCITSRSIEVHTRNPPAGGERVIPRGDTKK